MLSRAGRLVAGMKIAWNMRFYVAERWLLGSVDHCVPTRCLAENLTKSNCCHFYAFHLIWRATERGAGPLGLGPGRCSNTPVGPWDVLSFHAALQMDHLKCHIWLLWPKGAIRAVQSKWNVCACNENFLFFPGNCLALISPKDESQIDGRACRGNLWFMCD